MSPACRKQTNNTLTLCSLTHLYAEKLKSWLLRYSKTEAWRAQSRAPLALTALPWHSCSSSRLAHPTAPDSSLLHFWSCRGRTGTLSDKAGKLVLSLPNKHSLSPAGSLEALGKSPSFSWILTVISVAEDPTLYSVAFKHFSDTHALQEKNNKNVKRKHRWFRLLLKQAGLSSKGSRHWAVKASQKNCIYGSCLKQFSGPQQAKALPAPGWRSTREARREGFRMEAGAWSHAWRCPARFACTSALLPPLVPGHLPRLPPRAQSLAGSHCSRRAQWCVPGICRIAQRPGPSRRVTEPLLPEAFYAPRRNISWKDTKGAIQEQ